MPSKAMIVLASEQLWPNIHGIVHWTKTGPNNDGLSDLFIYYTDDEKRSARPARSLKVLCDKQFPTIRVHLPPQPMPITPEAVHDQIRLWQKQHPNQRWIINATGGLKLMFAGITDLVGTDNTDVVYRELSGQWYRLLRQSGAIVSEPIDVSADETDSIPVLTLVKAHWLPAEGTDWTGDPPKRIDVLRLTDAALRKSSWRDAFAYSGESNHEQDGFLFEKFIAVVLLELGVENLRINSKLTSASGQVQHEIDLVANYKGRLRLLDVKLREDDDASGSGNITTQIRQAAATQKALGGLGAKILLVRPNREFTPDQRALAQAQGVDVLDRNDKWELFSCLARWLGIRQLPEPLQDGENRLRAASKSGQWCAFEQKPRLVEELEESPANDGGLLEHTVVDLDAYNLALQQDWLAYLIDAVLHLRCRKPEHISAHRAEMCLRNFLAPFGQVVSLNRSNTGTTLWCEFRPSSGRRAALFDRLAQFRCRSLLGSLAGELMPDTG
ncbi:MAG: hypothetical protein KatS3mg105_0070 [Gemmatales bacterium]|nr:MAG: hypothetical protein KatS3mg105_0070 [Gemmatales bacterium]